MLNALTAGSYSATANTSVYLVVWDEGAGGSTTTQIRGRRMNADGTFVVTKHPGTGGRVSIPSVSEQLVYEMGDPHNYITPDCVLDITGIRLTQEAENRVRQVRADVDGPRTGLRGHHRRADAGRCGAHQGELHR